MDSLRAIIAAWQNYPHDTAEKPSWCQNEQVYRVAEVKCKRFDSLSGQANYKNTHFYLLESFTSKHVLGL